MSDESLLNMSGRSGSYKLHNLLWTEDFPCYYIKGRQFCEPNFTGEPVFDNLKGIIQNMPKKEPLLYFWYVKVNA